MADRNSNKFIEENSTSSEFFVYKREESNKIIKEDFVFKFEENQMRQEDNDTGLEENKERLNKKSKEEEEKADEDRKQEQENKTESNQSEAQTTSQSTSASSSSGSSASTASATSASASASAVSSGLGVAAATLTSVVVVVAGGMIIYNQTIQPPKICEFAEVYAIENKIGFKLNVGDTDKEATSENPGEACDIIVELRYETYFDAIEVKNYGAVSHEFTDLKYDTEYTLSVVQQNLLDLNQSILLTRTVKTESSPETPVVPPEPVNSFNIEIQATPVGELKFYSTITTIDSMDEYKSFYVRIINGERDPAEEGLDWEGSADVTMPITERQELKFEYFTAFMGNKYTLGLYGTKSVPDTQPIKREGVDTETGMHDEDFLIFGEVIDTSSMSAATVEPQNYIYFKRYAAKEGDSWTCYADYIDDDSYYSSPSMVFYSVDDESTIPTEGDIAFRITNQNGFEGLKTLTTLHDTRLPSTEGADAPKYYITIIANSTKPSDISEYGSGTEDYVEAPVYSCYVDFAKIPTEYEPTDANEPTSYNYVTLEMQRSYHGSRAFYADFGVYDPLGYWTDYQMEVSGEGINAFTINFVKTDDPVAAQAFIANNLDEGDAQTIDYHGPEGNMNILVTAASTYPGQESERVVIYNGTPNGYSDKIYEGAVHFTREGSTRVTMTAAMKLTDMTDRTDSRYSFYIRMTDMEGVVDQINFQVVYNEDTDMFEADVTDLFDVVDGGLYNTITWSVESYYIDREQDEAQELFIFTEVIDFSQV